MLIGLQIINLLYIEWINDGYKQEKWHIDFNLLYIIVSKYANNHNI